METSKIKIATHACFNKGMNDLPVIDTPLFNGWLKRPNLPNDPTFGLSFEDDPILHCVCLGHQQALCLFFFMLIIQATHRKLLGAYIFEINHNNNNN